MTNHSFLSIEQAAKVIGVSRRTAYRLAALGELPTIQLGGCIKVPAAALEQWLKALEQAALDTCQHALADNNPTLRYTPRS